MIVTAPPSMTAADLQQSFPEASNYLTLPSRPNSFIRRFRSTFPRLPVKCFGGLISSRLRSGSRECLFVGGLLSCSGWISVATQLIAHGHECSPFQVAKCPQFASAFRRQLQHVSLRVEFRETGFSAVSRVAEFMASPRSARA